MPVELLRRDVPKIVLCQSLDVSLPLEKGRGQEYLDLTVHSVDDDESGVQVVDRWYSEPEVEQSFDNLLELGFPRLFSVL